MNCTEFLHSYSDYRDGLISDARTLHRIRVHVSRCARCARYDDQLRRGLGALGDIEPSPGSRTRLLAQLADHDPEAAGPLGAGVTSVAAALMLATAIALVVYSKRDQRPPAVEVVTTRAPGAASEPSFGNSFPIVVVNQGVPFVTFTGVSDFPFRMVGATEFQAQPALPLGIWANLPH